MGEPPVGLGYGLPVEVEQGGHWLPGWQFASTGGRHYVFWQAAPGVPVHGWVEASRIKRRALVHVAGRRTP